MLDDLEGLSELQVLTLEGNPCCQLPHYRRVGVLLVCLLIAGAGVPQPASLGGGGLRLWGSWVIHRAAVLLVPLPAA